MKESVIQRMEEKQNKEVNRNNKHRVYSYVFQCVCAAVQ